MDYVTVSTWIGSGLLEKLKRIRKQRPHSPTLTQIALHAVQEGLAVMDGPGVSLVRSKGETKYARRAFTFRLPVEIHQNVTSAMSQLPDVGSLSATLRYLLWIGVTRILENLGDSEADQAA